MKTIKKLQFDDNEIVLSVSAGDTIRIIELYDTHAHPVNVGYSYRPTELITFRKRNGGIMDDVYIIRNTHNFDMSKWREHVKALQLDGSVKANLTAYIEQRFLGLGFDDAPQYKFYLLEKVCVLPNQPRPKHNTAGGRRYRFGDLKKAECFVETARE